MFELKITGETPLELMANTISISTRFLESKDATQLGVSMYDSDGGRAEVDPAENQRAVEAVLSKAEQADANRAAVEPPPQSAPAQAAPASGQMNLFPPTPAPVAPPAAAPNYPAWQPQAAVAPAQPAPAAAITPPGAVPISAAPGFTQDQVGRAGADLITRDPSKREALFALLQQHGAQTLGQVPPERLGAVAMALRAMGANI